MGKEWYWGGSRRSSNRGEAETQIPSGCMCAVFQAFNLHLFHFSINQRQQPHSASPLPQDMHIPKAPSNSLESEDGRVSSISKEENLNIPKNIRVKTSGGARSRAGNLNEVCCSCSSPGTKTPTLVARLMGLDLLPDQEHSSSSPSSSMPSHSHVHLRLRQIKKHRNSTGSDTRSRRSDDVEHGRLSVQINKENINKGLDLELPGYSTSPRHYARQVVKRVQESVGRKVGFDITNTTVQHQSRFMDTNKPTTKPLTPNLQHQNTPPALNLETKSKPQTLPLPLPLQQEPAPPGKKTTNQNLTSSRLNKPPQTSSIRNKQQESFITRSPSPTTPNHTKTKRPTHALPSIPQKQKKTQSQVSDTKEPKGRAPLSSCWRQRYKQQETHTLANRRTIDKGKSNGVSTTTGVDDEGLEFQYMTAILSRAGVQKSTLVQPPLHFQCFSPFHPLNPSIFHQLEHYPTSNGSVSKKNQLGPRCNRRLLFDLVDQVLSEISVMPKYWYGGLLAETVWKRVRSFPRAKCEVLEDIDGLIEMEDTKEEEGVMVEIEKKILETLVHETVAVMGGGAVRRLDDGMGHLMNIVSRRVSRGRGSFT